MWFRIEASHNFNISLQIFEEKKYMQYSPNADIQCDFGARWQPHSPTLVSLLLFFGDGKHIGGLGGLGRLYEETCSGGLLFIVVD